MQQNFYHGVVICATQIKFYNWVDIISTPPGQRLLGGWSNQNSTVWEDENFRIV